MHTTKNATLLLSALLLVLASCLLLVQSEESSLTSEASVTKKLRGLLQSSKLKTRLAARNALFVQTGSRQLSENCMAGTGCSCTADDKGAIEYSSTGCANLRFDVESKAPAFADGDCKFERKITNNIDCAVCEDNVAKGKGHYTVCAKFDAADGFYEFDEKRTEKTGWTKAKCEISTSTKNCHGPTPAPVSAFSATNVRGQWTQILSMNYGAAATTTYCYGTEIGSTEGLTTEQSTEFSREISVGVEVGYEYGAASGSVSTTYTTSSSVGESIAKSAESSITSSEQVCQEMSCSGFFDAYPPEEYGWYTVYGYQYQLSGDSTDGDIRTKMKNSIVCTPYPSTETGDHSPPVCPPGFCASDEKFCESCVCGEVSCLETYDPSAPTSRATISSKAATTSKASGISGISPGEPLKTWSLA